MNESPVVVLLDPLRPHVFPLEALPFLSGAIDIDPDVPDSVRGALPATTPGAAVTVMMDTAEPKIEALSAAGVKMIRAEPIHGDRLVEAASIMDRLWNRGGWESTQTHESLSVYLVEETYEVLDAIRSDDESDLREELGDLLLQVLFHSRIAQSHDVFELDDVAGALIAKLVHRSPHLVSSGVVDIAEQERAWDALKAAEKARASSMDGIARSQPPLLLAEKVLSRAAKAGVVESADEADLEALIEQCRRADTALLDALDMLIADIRIREGRRFQNVED
ncbi:MULTISPECIES: MazG family protein [Rhodococcus]|nr:MULTISPECIES: MazG family protein [Rhodococcus]AGT93855.1 nucleoside triphosphate pyrophosphohydrolase [Rhodococcus erythropolis CCM2595]KIM15515.1 nucleoside triphosphate hydrolase [Rhodococcus erythropolis]MDI9905589.1 MazG family protein [Rhodococcus sp. IEGM 1406]SUE11791.1 nucleoside triphosphate pyrophosphohydrolase [Rhodococcus erythropolis]